MDVASDVLPVATARLFCFVFSFIRNILSCKICRRTTAAVAVAAVAVAAAAAAAHKVCRKKAAGFSSKAEIVIEPR